MRFIVESVHSIGKKEGQSLPHKQASQVSPNKRIEEEEESQREMCMSLRVEVASPAAVPEDARTVRFTYQRRRLCRNRFCLHASSLDGRLNRCYGEMDEKTARARIAQMVAECGGEVFRTNESKKRLRILACWPRPSFEECLAAFRRTGEDPIRRATLDELALSENVE